MPRPKVVSSYRRLNARWAYRGKGLESLGDAGERVFYRHEYTERIRVGYIGCGGHSFRNVLPTFQYAPIELVATCDLDLERAKAYARQFGGQRAYSDHREMLEKEELDAVFIVTGYDHEGEPQSTPLAQDALEAGVHVWMEKPQSGRPERIEELIRVAGAAGKWVMVGYKKIFFPAIVKAKELMTRADFGALTSLYGRYPQSLPPYEARRDGRAMIGFLDHIVHPMSILYFLGGPIHSLRFVREPRQGASVTSLTFVNGAIGTLHLTAGQSGTSPLERVEAIGEGANLVVDNGVHLTYYRPGSRGDYGRSPSFLTPDDQAPLVWAPEFSLGQLYNKNLFMLGYAQEVRYFADCVLRGIPPKLGNLEMALEMAKVYQAYQSPDGTEVVINPV